MIAWEIIHRDEGRTNAAGSEEEVISSCIIEERGRIKVLGNGLARGSGTF